MLSTTSWNLVFRWPHEPQYCQALEQLCLPKAVNLAGRNLLQHFDWETYMATTLFTTWAKRKDCKYHQSKKLAITSACTTHNRLLNLECKWHSDFAKAHIESCCNLWVPVCQVSIFCSKVISFRGHRFVHIARSCNRHSLASWLPMCFS